MKRNLEAFLLVLPFFLMSCSPEGEDSSTIDRNQDGRADVWFESDIEFVYELVDRNFDGRVDETVGFNLSDQAEVGKRDDDFDSVLETIVEFSDEYELARYIDSDKNKLIDRKIVFESGVVVKGYRFDFDKNVSQEITYKFGLPVTEKEMHNGPTTEFSFHKMYCNEFCLKYLE